jgi:LPXTG-site transpeptidase (sortase) family protein
MIIPAVTARGRTESSDSTTVLPRVDDSGHSVRRDPNRERTMLLRTVRAPTAPPPTRSRWTALYSTRAYREHFNRIAPPDSTARIVIQTTGEIMVTLGMVLLLFAAYMVWGKSAIVSNHQNALDAELAQEWAQDPVVAPTEPAPENPDEAGPPVVPGESIGRLYVPRIGKFWVVVEGVEPADIEYAPGHYPETAMPGEVGNFSVAGHRLPPIFWDLDRLQAGDAVVMETKTTWYVYTVTQVHIVSPNAVEVVAPVPPGMAPGGEYLTLTTCNPKWDNYERLIVHAELDYELGQDSGRPPELAGM